MRSPKDLMLLRNRIYPSDYFTAFVLPLQLNQQRPNERWKHFLLLYSRQQIVLNATMTKNYAFELYIEILALRAIENSPPDFKQPITMFKF